MTTKQLTQVQLDQLRRLDSATLANAIETFDVRIRNAGFTDSRVHCLFPEFSPVIGYAATARIRTSNPPMEGLSFYERTDWWNHLLKIPAPRIVVVEDVDDRPGLGSFMGDVHGNILYALGCLAIVTNGAVRGFRTMRTLGFQMFAGNLSASHAYCHIVDFGGPVKVGGMQVRPGDLLHGDAHGVQTIPFEIIDRLPAVAEKIIQNKERIMALCHSPEFTLAKIQEAMKDWPKIL